ncbi:MAG: flagellar biosynthetic protein FliP [Alphaproteobacteria bacterium]|nr:MAG: flagellar biosynthetic protein FliP [Alphaproteobacteria bacterium]
MQESLRDHCPAIIERDRGTGPLAASVILPGIVPFGVLLAGAFLFGADPAAAQTLQLDFGDGGGSTTARLLQLILLITVLSLAPSILVMVTSFTRIVVVLSFLRSALGIQQTPPNSVLISLALFLTLFVMMPTLETVYDRAIQPLMNEEVSELEAIDLAAQPVRKFMLAHVREQDLKLFLDLSKAPPVASPEETPLRSLIPAFMISELRRAFEIGFLLFLPFIVIDMVVASVLMSMGMLMLPPIMISLPFKLIFFVLVDGWYLVAGSLVQSYG